jgi:HK97 family phage major capsid protein
MAQPKQESSNAGNVQSALMQTIATFKDVPRQLLRYIAGVRQVLDDELIGAVLAKLEDEVLNGDGTAGHFAGLFNQITQAGTGADLITAILNGIGKVQTQGGTPTGIVMNPSDYWALVAHAYTNNKYTPITANGQFAGIPVALVTSCATTKAIVGDFARGARLYDGESANVRATEGPGAKSNIVTLIAETDAVLVVGKPNYFAEITAALPS